MRKHITLPALLVLTASIAACSTPPNSQLEEAGARYSKLLGDPKASQLAPLETKDAGEYLLKAEAAFRDGLSKHKVDDLAYLTSKRVELAQQTIDMKTAEIDLQNAAAERSKARLEARDAQIKRLQDSLKAKPSDHGTVVTFGDMLFETGHANLQPGAMANIVKLAQFLHDNPERKLIVEGYTDSTGSDALNQDLSQRRAEAVQRALVRQGVEAARISTNGYGKEFPVASNQSAASRAMNRRVEVTISNGANPVAPRY